MFARNSESTGGESAGRQPRQLLCCVQGPAAHPPPARRDARTDGGRRDADVPLQPAGRKNEKVAAGCEARPAAALTEPSVNRHQQQQQLRWFHMEEPRGRG